MRIPGLDEMCYCEQGTKDNANPSNGYVGYPEEWVLSPHHSSSRYHDRFCSSINVDWEVWFCVSTRKQRNRGCVLLVISTWYMLHCMVSLSLRLASLLKFGRPAVLIQTWKASSSFKFGGGFSVLYPFCHLKCQLGGTVISE